MEYKVNTKPELTKKNSGYDSSNNFQNGDGENPDVEQK